MLLTSSVAESIHQKLLVAVLLADYQLTACNKGCRWRVSKNSDNYYGNLFVYVVFLTGFH